MRPCSTGLGDKLLDLVGTAVLAGLLPGIDSAALVLCNAEANPNWWGNYDQSLVEHDRISLVNNMEDLPRGRKLVVGGTCGCSLHPFKLEALCKRPVLDQFREEAAAVRPGRLVRSFLPEQVGGDTVGVHIRTGDKIDGGNTRHGTAPGEQAYIMARLRDAVVAGTTYFVCAQDPAEKASFERHVLQKGGAVVQLPELPDVQGLAAAVDLFTLARCGVVMQGTGYSTFSMVASLIGGGRLRNLLPRAGWDACHFLRWWAPVLRLSSCVPEGAFYGGSIRDPTLTLVEDEDVQDAAAFMQASGAAAPGPLGRDQQGARHRTAERGQAAVDAPEMSPGVAEAPENDLPHP